MNSLSYYLGRLKESRYLVFYRSPSELHNSPWLYVDSVLMWISSVAINSAALTINRVLVTGMTGYARAFFHIVHYNTYWQTVQYTNVQDWRVWKSLMSLLSSCKCLKMSMWRLGCWKLSNQPALPQFLVITGIFCLLNFILTYLQKHYSINSPQS